MQTANNEVITMQDAETGEVIEREATTEEIAQRAKDAVAVAAWKKEIEKAENAKATAKASALAKLAALGLTEDEVNGLIS